MADSHQREIAPNLGRFNDNRAQLETGRAGLLALIAMRRYRLKPGHDATPLSGMNIPADPYSGKPFQITKTVQGLQINSVGKDSKGSPIVYHLNQ